MRGQRGRGNGGGEKEKGGGEVKYIEGLLRAVKELQAGEECLGRRLPHGLGDIRELHEVILPEQLVGWHVTLQQHKQHLIHKSPGSTQTFYPCLN